MVTRPLCSIFTLAKERDLDIDFHTDENGNELARGLRCVRFALGSMHNSSCGRLLGQAHLSVGCRLAAAGCCSWVAGGGLMVCQASIGPPLPNVVLAWLGCRYVAQKAFEHGYQGRVVCGHCW